MTGGRDRGEGQGRDRDQAEEGGLVLGSTQKESDGVRRRARVRRKVKISWRLMLG